MALLFDFYLSPHTRGTYKKRYHARPASTSNLSIEKLLKETAKHSVFSEDELRTALGSILDTMKQHLAEGHHIQIPGLGGFQVSLSCPETRTPQSTRSGSVSIKSVSYQPDKKLIADLRSKAEFKRVKYKKHSLNDGDIESVKENLRIFFQTNRYVTRKDMETHCFLTYSTAARRLKDLVEMGILTQVSRDPHHPFYELIPGALDEDKENHSR